MKRTAVRQRHTHAQLVRERRALVVVQTPKRKRLDVEGELEHGRSHGDDVRVRRVLGNATRDEGARDDAAVERQLLHGADVQVRSYYVTLDGR